jgi:hypothetical protein
LIATRNRYARGTGEPVDTVPPLPQLQERVLHQIRGIRPVPRHEVQELEEPPVLVSEERREVQRAFLRDRSRTTSPSACMS